MNFQPKRGIDAHVHPVERDPGPIPHFQLHDVAVANPIKLRVRRAHVRMHRRPDDALLEFHHALRTHDEGSRCSLDVTGEADRQILDSQRDGIREGQLNL